MTVGMCILTAAIRGVTPTLSWASGVAPEERRRSTHLEGKEGGQRRT